MAKPRRDQPKESVPTAAATPSAGNGLGLYGSRLIVEAHGGHIWIQSVVGTGSTVLLSLPIGEPVVLQRNSG